MRKLLLFVLLLVSAQAFAQPSIWGATKIKFENGDTSYIRTAANLKDFVAAYFSGGGTVSSVTVTSANGLAGTVANSTSTPNITLTTTVNSPVLSGNGTAIAAGTTTGTGSTVVLNNGPTLIAPALGTPASGTLTNATGLPISTGVSGLGTGVATFLATPSTANLATAVTGETGTGALVFATSPTFVTPLLGTPTSGVLTNATGLPLTTGVTGILPTANGGTANAFFTVSGPAATAKTFTFPNASATVLTSNAAVTVAQGGTGATTLTGPLYGNGTGAITGLAIGADVTLYGSNGSAPIYYTPVITHNDAAFSYSRSTANMNLNIPNATAALGGIVSTTTQTFAGNKTWGGTHTQTGLFTGNGGIVGVSGASQAAIDIDGVEDGSFRTVTITSTVDENDGTVFVGTLAADITINLPACNSTRDGWTYRFMKKGSDAFAFILDPATTETFFDGATTKSFYGQGNSITCKCENGLGWNLLR